MSQSVVPTFNRWMLTPDMFDMPVAVNFPEPGAGPGLLFHQTGTLDPAGATKYPASIPVFSPRNILRPARDTVDVLAYVWWGIDLSLIGAAAAAKTKVMWGAEMATFWDGGPVQTAVYTSNVWGCRKSTGVGYSDIWQDVNGDVPASRLVLSRTDSGISFDSNNGVVETQAATLAVNPQMAVSVRTFDVGETVCGVYRDQLKFLYKSGNDILLSDSVSFKNLKTEVVGPAASLTGTDVSLTGTSTKTANNSFQVWRLDAGYPATGVFATGFDFDADGANDVDNYAGPVNFLGLELYIV
jgi:hypothetical protein